MRLKACIFVLLLLMSAVVSSQGVMIRGANSCGMWIEQRAQDTTSRLTRAVVLQGWIVGYLSGLASESGKNFWGYPNINSLDNESVFLWIDNYCRANPLKHIDDAGDALFRERCAIASNCR